MVQIRSMAVALAICGSVCYAQRQSAPTVKSAALGSTNNVHVCGDLFLAGQPTPDDIHAIKEKGVRRVITLRTDGEIEWDEKAAVEAAGLEFVSIPLRGVETLTDEALDRITKLLGDQSQATILHCGSANRVGGVWIAHRVLNQGVEIETAVAEAKEIGSRNPDYEKRVREYIVERRTEASGAVSARPGLNDNFLKPDLDVTEWIDRFEVESREVFSARAAVVKACELKSGMSVADVGAGTGLYTHLFAEAVGESGRVFAVDISPRFLQHINASLDENGVEHVTTVLGSAKNVRLPDASVDLVYVCDTYHHFEYPEETLASIHKALKPKGSLVVIDFERIPGKSRDWIIGHVRAGKDVFRSEIESAGFGFVEEVKIDGFEENYFLRFRKR